MPDNERIAMTSAVPVLPVRSTRVAADFYVDRLGFTVVHLEAGYAVLRRDDVQIHLWCASDEGWRERNASERPIVSGAESFLAGTASCRVQTTLIEQLHEACRAADIVHPNGPLADKWYGLREFAVLDADGNLVTFFERLTEVEGAVDSERRVDAG
jgi:catechol 2,3-dioxygenase-like lactoylglutathione lyase family enzyme